MDTASNIIIDGQIMIQYLHNILWYFMRIGGLIISAPVLGMVIIPQRIRLIFALSLALILMQLTPQQHIPEAFSSQWYMAMIFEFLIGVLIGLALRLAFETASITGELISQTMGLSFAQMANPINGGSTTLISQILFIIGTLFFFTHDIHLQLIQVLMLSYNIHQSHDSNSILTMMGYIFPFMAQVFIVGVQIAIPFIVALLVINMIFGVLSRTAPMLNPIAVGFPASLFAGLVLLIIILPFFSEFFVKMLQQSLEMIITRASSYV